MSLSKCDFLLACNSRVLHCLKWSHRCSNPYAQASSRELSKHSKLVLPWSSLISRLPSLCWQRLFTWSFVYNFSSHWVNSATNQCRTGQTSQGKYIFCLSVICVCYLGTVWHLLLVIIGHSSAREHRQARWRRRPQDRGEHIHSPPTPWFPSTAPITQLLLYPSPSFAQHQRGRIFSNTRCPPKKCDLLLVNLTSSVCRIISTCKSNLLACLGHLIHLIQLL